MTFILALVAVLESLLVMQTLGSGKGCNEAVDHIRGHIKAVQVNSTRTPPDARILFTYKDTPGSRTEVTREYAVCDVINRAATRSAFYGQLSPAQESGAQVELGLCLSRQPCVIAIRRLK
ncbi:MAG: hypothetical protein HY074_19345 [Deltaproteobacteria bacterium]|nr:hypothetical protein [Deltaproteobacteria bacterium]